MSVSPNRVNAIIIVAKGSNATTLITEFIGKHINAITQRGIVVEFKFATPANQEALRRKGITQTPTMIIGKNVFVGHDNIIRALTPNRDRKLGPGPGSLTDEESLQREMMREMTNRTEDPDEKELREEEIRKRTAEMQSRRTVMAGLPPGDKPVPGGRAVRQKADQGKKFESDNDFISASQRDNIMPTPTERTYSEIDGQATLEDYWNREADSMGRQHKKTQWRRPTAV